MTMSGLDELIDVRNDVFKGFNPDYDQNMNKICKVIKSEEIDSSKHHTSLINQ